MPAIGEGNVAQQPQPGMFSFVLRRGGQGGAMEDEKGDGGGGERKQRRPMDEENEDDAENPLDLAEKRSNIEEEQQIEMFDTEQLKTKIEELFRVWTPPKQGSRYRAWVYERFNLPDTENETDLGKLRERYWSLKIARIMRVFIQCQRAELTGDHSDEAIANLKKFGRLFDAITNAYVSIDAEHRARAAMDLSRSEYLPPEVALFRSSQIDCTNNTPYQNLLLHLLLTASNRRYKRYRGCCYQEIVTPQGHRTNAWEKASTIKEFVYQAVKKETNYQQWRNLTNSTANKKHAIEYLTECHDAEFSDLKPDRHVFAFPEGKFFADEGAFFTYEEMPAEHKARVACKYFKTPFPTDYPQRFQQWYDYPTPSFQAILDHQKFGKESGKDLDQEQHKKVCEWMYIFVGRLIFEVNEADTWQIMPFIKGVAGSGKSTIAKIARNFYPPDDVGNLSANMEDKFGLSALVDKLMFVCYEAKKEMTLKQSDFQSIVSGEEMMIAFKFLGAETRVWVVPGIFCGNEVPDWIDTAGSIVRRCVLFEFLRRVTAGDPRLFAKMKLELPALMLKSTYAYLEAAEMYGHMDLWDYEILQDGKKNYRVLPAYFHNTRQRLECTVNSLVSFLDGSDVMELKKDGIVPFKTFKEQYCKFLMSNGHKRVKFDSDVYEPVFDQYDIKVRAAEENYNGEKISQRYVYGVQMRQHLQDADANGSGQHHGSGGGQSSSRRSPNMPRSAAAGHGGDAALNRAQLVSME